MVTVTGFRSWGLRKRRSLTLGATAAGLGLVVTGCVPPISSIDPSLIGVALTTYAADTHSVELSGGDLVIRAPAENQAGAMRITVMPVAAPVVANQESCATWVQGTGHYFRQEGASLRMATVDGVTRGITVTKHVYEEKFWHFNVHTWDTSVPTTDTTSPATMIATFDLGASFGTGSALRPLPWRICARAVGDVLAFKVWPLSVGEPVWGNPAYGGSVRVPVGGLHAGRAGWYSGHLQPGSTMVFANRSVRDLTSALRTAGPSQLTGDLAPREPLSIPGLP